jgi:hypothetical protein
MIEYTEGPIKNRRLPFFFLLQNDRTYKRGTIVLGLQSEVKDHNTLDHPSPEDKRH